MRQSFDTIILIKTYYLKLFQITHKIVLTMSEIEVPRSAKIEC